MRNILASLAILLFSSSSFADGKPEAPVVRVELRRPPKKVFWIGTASLAGAKAFDAFETRRILDSGGWESNPFYGKRPSVGRQVAVNSLSLAGQAVLFHFTEKSKHKVVRWLGRGYVGYAVAEHAYLGACAATMEVHPQTANRSCAKPFLF